MIDGNHRKNLVIGLIRECMISMREHGTILINEDEYEDVSDFIPTAKSLCEFLIEDAPNNEIYCERIADTNNIVLYKGDFDHLGELYNIICSDSVTFSGTVGVKQVEKDGGISAHLDYLRLFLEPRGLDFISKNLDLYNKDLKEEKDVINLYMDLYTRLKKYFEDFPMAMYSLMTGIKKVYNLPNSGIIITPEKFEMVDFRSFKDINLINQSHESFTYELSDNNPNLKIYHEGIKLMHLRTKIDYKSKKFRLRFMMETGKNFFRIFEKLSEK